MTDLLVKLFVKDYEQTDNLQVRTRYGLLSGMVGSAVMCSYFWQSFLQE